VDFGGDLNDRKSRIGYIYTLASSVIAWGSHRQGCTANSTTQAELVAYAKSVDRTNWLVCLLIDIGIAQKLPITIFYDNQVAIQVIKNPDYLNRNKHADLKYYFI
jgi:hypothetical protein